MNSIEKQLISEEAKQSIKDINWIKVVGIVTAILYVAVVLVYAPYRLIFG